MLVKKSRLKRLKNEFRKRKPLPSEIAAAQKLAKKVSQELHGLMEAKVKDANIAR